MIRWGIIGCGDVTEVKSGPGFQAAKDSQLVSVMRRTPGLAEDYARRHGVPKWTTDAQALIDDDEVDAVYIATPPGSHLSYALRVAAAGKPAYVEKPMARSAAECDQMVAAFEKAGVKLFVAYYRRALPRFLKVKELIEGGALGTLTGVTYTWSSSNHRRIDPGALPWRVRAEESGGGLFLDLGSHTLDILDFILGPLWDVNGSAANLASPYDVEDSVSLSFLTAAGVPGTALWNFASSRREDLITFSGTDGTLYISTFGQEPIRLVREEGTEEFDLPNPRTVQGPLIQRIVDDLHGRGSAPSTGVTARRTSEVMDQALWGFYGGRDDAFWERPRAWPGARR